MTTAGVVLRIALFSTVFAVAAGCGKKDGSSGDGSCSEIWRGRVLGTKTGNDGVPPQYENYDQSLQKHPTKETVTDGAGKLKNFRTYLYTAFGEVSEEKRFDENSKLTETATNTYDDRKHVVKRIRVRPATEDAAERTETEVTQYDGDGLPVLETTTYSDETKPVTYTYTYADKKLVRSERVGAYLNYVTTYDWTKKEITQVYTYPATDTSPARAPETTLRRYRDLAQIEGFVLGTFLVFESNQDEKRTTEETRTCTDQGRLVKCTGSTKDTKTGAVVGASEETGFLVEMTSCEGTLVLDSTIARKKSETDADGKTTVTEETSIYEAGKSIETTVETKPKSGDATATVTEIRRTVATLDATGMNPSKEEEFIDDKLDETTTYEY